MSPPIFDPVPDLTVNEGESLTVTISATDPDGDVVTITPMSIPNWTSFENNVLTLSPDLNRAGDYSISFRASDGRLTDLLRVNITVINVNQTPSLVSLRDVTVRETASMMLRVNAPDPDGDILTYTVSPSLNWASFRGDTLRLTPGYEDSGEYDITVTVSDALSSVSDTFHASVINTNRPPVFTTSSLPSISENSTVALPITASDADGDEVTVSALGLTSWMTFDGTNLLAMPGYEDAGSYDISFIANDSTQNTLTNLTLLVSDVNRQPVLDPLNSSWTIGDGTKLSFPVIGTDPDGDDITLSADSLEAWMSFDGEAFRASPPLGTNDNFNITFTASDDASSVSQNITVRVRPGEPGFPTAWKNYIGSVGENGADWATWQRYWLGSATGISLVEDPAQVSLLAQEASRILSTHDLMIPVAGFARNEQNMADFLNLIHDGGVLSWNDAVRSQVLTLSELDPEADRVFYQLGNEVTSLEMSNGVRNWAASRGIDIPGTAQEYDEDTIFYYIEYYVAPTVEAARQESEAFYGNSNAITILLGSITNGGNEGARNYIDKILDYEVQGVYAQSLAGMKVNEIIDIVSVHYVGPNENLDPIWDKWRDVGSIRGLWTTEEIGSKAVDAGEGAARAINTTANQLAWFYRRQLTPDQSRVAYFDWNLNGPADNTSPNTSMTDFQEFFGGSPLEVFNAGVAPTTNADELITFRYNSIEDNNKRAIVVVPTRGNIGGFTLDSLTFEAKDWQGTIDAEAYFYTTQGPLSEQLTLTDIGGFYTMQFSSPLSFDTGAESLFITLTRP